MKRLTGLDFYDACRIVAETERKIKFKNGPWRSLEYNQLGLSVDTNEDWWPTPRQAKEKVWEVEPEKPKEIIVWCVCHPDGTSAIFSAEPKKDAYGNWILLSNTFPSTPLIPDNSFPEDKPQKFKLVSVRDE